MRDLNTVDYFEPVDKLAKILCQKTQGNDPQFFRILVSYHLAKVASMMRCSIDTMNRGNIPVSMYALNLAVSGHGKGFSTNIIEEQVTAEFKKRFLESTFPTISKTSLAILANKRALKNGLSSDHELELTTSEFEDLGTLAFSFDSGTTAAVKQMRHKLLMSGAGSMNMEIDEIGSNLIGQTDILTTFLELYDVGKIKQKLVKNTKENIRNEEIDGRTPTNMMLFGTPTKLLDGAKTEDDFYSFLETGYARRCVFGFSRTTARNHQMSVQDIYDMYQDTAPDAYIQQLSHELAKLANSINFGINLQMDKDVTMLDIEYRVACERKAATLPSHQEVKKTELSHRYFKTLKMAGSYAFFDQATEIGIEHYYSAMKLVEDSGESFDAILTRDRNYVRLANYIADCGSELTHADIQQDLAFYKGGEHVRRDLMNMAIAWGYKNNVIIKKSYDGDIEFLTGESLDKSNLNAIHVSYSQDQATGYISEDIPFDEFHRLTQETGFHFTNHHLLTPRRKEVNCKPGFNMVVLDVDSGCSFDTAKMLIGDYKFLMYTTKRHKPGKAERFRVVLPISHELEMGADEFKEFMQNIYSWLPFEVDMQTGQRARKWLTHDGYYEYNDGKLLDALLFIPKTKKSEERQNIIDSQQSLSNVERWFANNTGTGNRSNQLMKYGYMLVDSGMNVSDIQDKIVAFNNKLPDKLEESEIFSTIMQTVSKGVHKRNSK